MRFEIYKDRIREWRWRLISPNGNILAVSSESYKNRKDVTDIVKTIQQKARDAAVKTKLDVVER